MQISFQLLFPRLQIKNQHLEFTRSRQAYLRLQDKHAKAVKDAETVIRQRSLSLELEKKTLLGKEKEKTVKDSFSKVSRNEEDLNSGKRIYNRFRWIYSRRNQFIS